MDVNNVCVTINELLMKRWFFGFFFLVRRDYGLNLGPVWLRAQVTLPSDTWLIVEKMVSREGIY